MKKHLNHLKLTIFGALKLVNKNPKIIFASLAMSIASLAGRITDFPFLALAISLMLFSWGFVELDLLNQAKQGKKVAWNNLVTKVLYYLKKTWPIIALGLVLLILVIPILVNLYLMQGSEYIQKFMVSAINMPLFILTIDILTTLISLWFVQTMVILVVDNQPIFRSLKLSGQYLIKNLWFLIAITIILSLIGLFTRTLVEISPFVIATRIGYLLFSAYLGLIIKSVLLNNYLK